MARTPLPDKDCQCEKCKRGCITVPGWFLPGEAERAAEYLGLSLEAFFKKYLGVNWWEGNEAGRNDENSEETPDHPVFVLAPAITTMTPGAEYPGDPRGRCVFFDIHDPLHADGGFGTLILNSDDGFCQIHAVKPYECRKAMHNQSARRIQRRHWRVSRAWNTSEHQDQIVQLLGGKPVAASYEPPVGSWPWLFDSWDD